MNHTDNEKFNNRGRMIYDLRLAGVKGIGNNISEQELVFQYNLQFLANTYDHQIESRNLGINRTRTSTGKFK